MSELSKILKTHKYVHTDHDYFWLESMHFNQLLHGIHPGSFKSSFNACELGCGYGDTLIFLAIFYPEATFTGFDYNPTHIDYANQKVKQLGMENIHFETQDFRELHLQKSSTYDYILCHGVFSWINDDCRKGMLDFVQRTLNENGKFYLDYLHSDNWSKRSVVHKVISEVFANDHEENTLRVQGGLDFIEALGDHSSFHHYNEDVIHWFNRIKKRRLDYLAHDYLTDGRRSFTLSSVYRQTSERGLILAGTNCKNQNCFFKKLPIHSNEMPFDQEYNNFLFGSGMRYDIFQKNKRCIGEEEANSALMLFKVYAKSLTVPDTCRVVYSGLKKEIEERIVISLLQFLRAEGPQSLLSLASLLSMSCQMVIHMVSLLIRLDLVGIAPQTKPNTAVISNWNTNLLDSHISRVIVKKHNYPLNINYLERLYIDCSIQNNSKYFIEKAITYILEQKEIFPNSEMVISKLPQIKYNLDTHLASFLRENQIL